ncbi:unnamed protein product [Moneuplotes crassus]|uniref:Uncharacterized protein n=1 Tax=Euplotes crassus TaxID=5936 RepID=A0AAD1XCB5_EUPCR|nr:unnamed protein product [Moneuplotes crassus]
MSFNTEEKKTTYSPIKRRKLQFRKKIKNLNLTFVDSPHSFKIPKSSFEANLPLEERVSEVSKGRELSMSQYRSRAVLSPVRMPRNFKLQSRKSVMRLTCISPIASPTGDKEISSFGAQIENMRNLSPKKESRVNSFKCQKFFQKMPSEISNPRKQHQKGSSSGDFKLPLFNRSEGKSYFRSKMDEFNIFHRKSYSIRFKNDIDLRNNKWQVYDIRNWLLYKKGLTTLSREFYITNKHSYYLQL